MQVFRNPSDSTAWIVKPNGAAEADFVEKLLSALADKYPDPPPERVIPDAVLKRVRSTSNPVVALQVVQRLNLSDDSQANLTQLYEWCRDTDGLSSLQSLIDELVEAGVVRDQFLVMDRHRDCGLELFDSRADIPSEMEDAEGDLFEVDDADVQVVYVRDAAAFHEDEK